MPVPNKGANGIWRIRLVEGQPHAFSIITALDALVDDRSRTKPQVRQYLVNVVLKSTRNNDLVGHIKTIFDYVVDNIIYLPDPLGSEFTTDPIYLLQSIAAGKKTYGDCDDHVALLATLLRAAGIPAKVAAVRLTAGQNIQPTNLGDAYYNHVIVVVPLNGGWKQLDPCAKYGQNPQYQDLLLAP